MYRGIIQFMPFVNCDLQMGFKYVCFSCHGLMGRVFDEFLVLMGFKFAQFLFPSLRVSLFFFNLVPF